MVIKEFTRSEAEQYVSDRRKKYMLFYVNVFGWTRYYTLHPTSATPSGFDRKFPRRVRIYGLQN